MSEGAAADSASSFENSYTLCNCMTKREKSKLLCDVSGPVTKWRSISSLLLSLAGLRASYDFYSWLVTASTMFKGELTDLVSGLCAVFRATRSALPVSAQSLPASFFRVCLRAWPCLERERLYMIEVWVVSPFRGLEWMTTASVPKTVCCCKEPLPLTSRSWDSAFVIWSYFWRTLISPPRIIVSSSALDDSRL